MVWECESFLAGNKRDDMKLSMLLTTWIDIRIEFVIIHAKAFYSVHFTVPEEIGVYKKYSEIETRSYQWT